MRDFAECKPLLDYIAAEHRQLRLTLQEVDAWLRSPTGTRDLVAIIDRLSNLRAHLARHFAEEEGEGCLEEAICRCPNLAPQAAQIEREHPELLLAVDDLMRRLKANSQGEFAAIVQAFSDIVHRLEAHECSENRILQQAFGTDQGCEDV